MTRNNLKIFFPAFWLFSLQKDFFRFLLWVCSKQHLLDCQLFPAITNLCHRFNCKKNIKQKKKLFSIHETSLSARFITIRPQHDVQRDFFFCVLKSLLFFLLFASCFHWAWKIFKALLFHIAGFFKLTRQVQMQFIF